MPKSFAIARSEPRAPLAIEVHLLGPTEFAGLERTFTENVSGRGARVLSIRRWHKNEQLTLALPGGVFSSAARVAYCQPVRDRGFAIGLELLAPDGQWVVANSAPLPAPAR